ncbi:YibE/F family protein [Desulfosediminicola sp.]|uniref:YibE/F family protein n=1 Tax=Desulfosediminicola sp. TaxID=2886825 RepID=UPI003AF1F534
MYKKLGSHLLLLVVIVSVIVAYYSWSGVSDPMNAEVEEVRAEVLLVDNSEVRSSGLSHIGYQELEVTLLEGSFAGESVSATNSLVGQSDIENIFKPGDEIIVAVILEEGGIAHVKAVDLYRQDALLLLFGIFVLALLLYAGVVGIKALLSFMFTVLIIWEVLVQRILAGYDPLMTTTLTLVLLSAVIIFLVAGLNRRGATAFIGTICGLCVTLLVTLLFCNRVGLVGMTQPYVNALVFSGYYQLDIREIFYSAIILGASGACMDIAMDIAASMDEVKLKKPEITAWELVQSGFNVGRHVIGTMATTLLLAYSGGYLTLLMIFQVKEPSIMRMLNLKIVAAEIMRTLVGSIGLVLVAPITALVGGLIISGYFTKRVRLLSSGRQERIASESRVNHKI